MEITEHVFEERSAFMKWLKLIILKTIFSIVIIIIIKIQEHAVFSKKIEGED